MSRRRQRGEGSIRPYETRGGTRFLCEWYEPIDPDDPEGGLRRRSKGGFLTQKDAAAALRAELTAVAEGRVTRSDEITVAQYAREWLAGARLAETTRAGYSKALRLHVIPYIGGRRLADLRPAHGIGLTDLNKTVAQSHDRGLTYDVAGFNERIGQVNPR